MGARYHQSHPTTKCNPSHRNYLHGFRTPLVTTSAARFSSIPEKGHLSPPSFISRLHIAVGISDRGNFRGRIIPLVAPSSLCFQPLIVCLLIFLVFATSSIVIALTFGKIHLVPLESFPPLLTVRKSKWPCGWHRLSRGALGPMCRYRCGRWCGNEEEARNRGRRRSKPWWR